MAAIDEGNRITALAQKALGGQLKRALSEGGVPQAVQFCNLAAYPIVDTLTTGFEVTIKRTSSKLRNPKNAPGEQEKQLFQSYNRMLAGDDPLKPNVIMLNSDQMLFVKPILLDNPLCLNCHGQVETEITKENYAVIKALYPQDQAIDFKLGDLRGIWSITFKQKDLEDFLKSNY